MSIRGVKKTRNLNHEAPVGANFSPASTQLSVGIIQKYFRNGFIEQRVYHHGNCGRIICKERQHGRLRLPPIDRLPQLSVIGHPLPREEPLVSPLTDRKAKLARIVECRPLVEGKIVSAAIDSPHISEEQTDYVTLRRSLSDRFGGDKQVSKLIEEIARIWHVWNRDAALCCELINEIPKQLVIVLI
uniref:Uncharacterized protein n=1 Tax=Parascaris univalens TaxID=6257 RepID=A0A915BMC4_PARUN